MRMNKEYLSSSASLGRGKIIVPDLRDGSNSLISSMNFNSTYTIMPQKKVLLDWGRKRAGWITIKGEGKFAYKFLSDLKLLDTLDVLKKDYTGQSQGVIELFGQPRRVEDNFNAFRFLYLENIGVKSATLNAAMLEPSEFHAQPIGSFQCSDEIINKGWQMGIDTLHLCTQPGEQSKIPVFAPFGEGFVQWDGCRRDREVWGGDLRPASLAWFYNFEDHDPVANSLYVIMNAQHRGCSEDGLFPGSGSSHQIVYEWAFWEVVCLWEYILHTGDKRLSRFACDTVPAFLSWCEKKFSEHSDGWLRADLTWMYTLKLNKQAPFAALQAVAVIGLEAMEKLFLHFDLKNEAQRSRNLYKRISKCFHKAFWDANISAYTSPVLEDSLQRCSDLGANCWAILSNIVEPENRRLVLDTIRKLHWTESGSINLAPALEFQSPHNGNIWPYANAYEVSTRFYCGDAEGALEIFRRYVNRIISIGHNTMLEMVHIDGSLPIMKNGELLSLCHAWSAQASWALQAYLLGVMPLKPGWRQFSFNPLKSPLKWVKGSVWTPFGLIEVEIERLPANNLAGKITHPKEAQCICDFNSSNEFEVIAK